MCECLNKIHWVTEQFCNSNSSFWLLIKQFSRLLVFSHKNKSIIFFKLDIHISIQPFKLSTFVLCKCITSTIEFTIHTPLYNICWSHVNISISYPFDLISIFFLISCYVCYIYHKPTNNINPKSNFNYVSLCILATLISTMLLLLRCISNYLFNEQHPEYLKPTS